MSRLAAADRRRQLLEVGRDLFAELGYRGATTARLASGAGVTEPVLYRHFQSKLDLFETLVNDVGREVIERWAGRLAFVHDPEARLRALLEGNPATDAGGRGVDRVIFRAINERHREPRIAAAIREHLTRLHRFLADEIARLQTAGVVRDDETAPALAWLLIDVAIGYGMVAPLGPQRRKPAQSVLRELLRPPG